MEQPIVLYRNTTPSISLFEWKTDFASNSEFSKGELALINDSENEAYKMLCTFQLESEHTDGKVCFRVPANGKVAIIKAWEDRYLLVYIPLDLTDFFIDIETKQPRIFGNSIILDCKPSIDLKDTDLKEIITNIFFTAMCSFPIMEITIIKNDYPIEIISKKEIDEILLPNIKIDSEEGKTKIWNFAKNKANANFSMLLESGIMLPVKKHTFIPLFEYDKEYKNKIRLGIADIPYDGTKYNLYETTEEWKWVFFDTCTLLEKLKFSPPLQFENVSKPVTAWYPLNPTKLNDRRIFKISSFLADDPSKINLVLINPPVDVSINTYPISPTVMFIDDDSSLNLESFSYGEWRRKDYSVLPKREDENLVKIDDTLEKIRRINVNPNRNYKYIDIGQNDSKIRICQVNQMLLVIQRKISENRNVFGLPPQGNINLFGKTKKEFNTLSINNILNVISSTNNDLDTLKHIQTSLDLFKRTTLSYYTGHLPYILALSTRESGVKNLYSTKNDLINTAGKDTHPGGVSGLDYIYDHHKYFTEADINIIRVTSGFKPTRGNRRPAIIQAKHLLFAFFIQTSYDLSKVHDGIRDVLLDLQSIYSPDALYNETSVEAKRVWLAIKFAGVGYFKAYLKNIIANQIEKKESINLNVILSLHCEEEVSINNKLNKVERKNMRGYRSRIWIARATSLCAKVIEEHIDM